MLSIGIDVGGTGIKVGVVDEKGTILCKDSIRTNHEETWQQQVHDMAECALKTVRDGGFDLKDIASVGVGVPGVTDPRTGNIAFCTNLGWRDIDFAGEFRKYLDKPVYINNDATVAGLAESKAGVSAGTDSSVFLTLGTGVGGGIVIHGKVWSGFHGVGSEIGHMILKMDGVPCTCGNRGCLERYCSATAVIRMGREKMAEVPGSLLSELCGGDPEKLEAKTVFDAAKAGDPAGVAVFNEYISCLGQAISNIIQFLDPEVIVLGGGVSKAGDFLLEAVRREVPKYLLYKTLPLSRIEIARLGADAGIIGAAMLGQT